MAAFPTSTVLTTDHLDNATDSPASARTEIKDSVTAVAAIIASYDNASGIAPLDSGGKIAAAKLPATLTTSSGNLQLSPNSAVVKVNNILELTPQTQAQLEALTGVTGQIAYCSDGNGSNPALAVYTGSEWKKIALTDTLD
jgi:hypothetical protein